MWRVVFPEQTTPTELLPLETLEVVPFIAEETEWGKMYIAWKRVILTPHICSMEKVYCVLFQSRTLVHQVLMSCFGATSTNICVSQLLPKPGVNLSEKK